ncbi:MAG: superoxide dismutase [Fimbriiglobus sp.]|jgi:Fe-Mn family superoxide dismutase|nr:superoxide dismutase [Fimbriiglobus sp.]
MPLTRRDALRAAAAGLAAAPTLFAVARAEDKKAPEFSLPKLPYAADALEPSIDALTMETHHGKHHLAYVTNLNNALKTDAPEFVGKPLEELLANLKKLPEKAQAAVRNNGGGHWNHTFFWDIMTPAAKSGAPSGDLLKAIEASFKSVDDFKKSFSEAAVKRFGSGWAWLVKTPDGKLAINSTPNQDNPLMDTSGTPLLGVDVWEHAYYLKYKNLRAKYVEEWWKVVNWDGVAARFASKK